MRRSLIALATASARTVCIPAFASAEDYAEAVNACSADAMASPEEYREEATKTTECRTNLSGLVEPDPEARPKTKPLPG
jgi:hypothetical protein